MSPISDPIISIEARTQEFQAALATAIEALLPVLWRMKLHRSRHRSRLVTRAKQRRHW